MIPRSFSVLVLAVLGSLVISCGSSGETSGPPAAPEASEAWQSAPVIPRFDQTAAARLRSEVARADRAGLRATVFAKVGDSNTEWEQNLYGLGCRPVDYGPRPGLAEVRRRYTRVRLGRLTTFPGCTPANSFSRLSAATVSGVWVEWLLTPVSELAQTSSIPAPPECPPASTPLSCELDLLKPRYALAMIGTNDALIGLPLGDVFRGHLTDLVREIRAERSVPVLSTLPPMPIPTAGGEPGDERIAEANRIIWEVARDTRTPLINLWRALTSPGMVNQGLAADELHLGVFGGEESFRVLANSAVLTPEALRYGANRRQLIWLQTLARLDRVAGR